MSRALNVTFVMPCTGERAAGGFRVIYQFANHLARRGHMLTVVHPGRLAIQPGPLDHVKNAVRYVLKKLDGRFTPKRWMEVDPGVRLTCVPSLDSRHVPNGDIVIATAWQTAEYVEKYPDVKGRKLYLVQHLETWNGPRDRVLATWKMPLRKIVPSRWLQKIAEDFSESAVHIPNGLDTKTFYTTTPLETRDPHLLLMLFHEAEWKGCDEGMQALKLVKEKIPDLRAIFFGVPAKPAYLPDWIEYHQSPEPDALRDLYNRASIFVAPSRTEGWGLTGSEALLCGAALAATDIDGQREYAFHEKTALTSPARDPQALADNILRLIQDPELRLRLAQDGREFVRKLTWERATDAMEATMLAEVSDPHAS